MKLYFPPEECKWLHSKITQLVSISRKREDSANIARLAAKMRYKFSGAPPVVFLTGKECRLLRDIAEYRLNSLETSPSEERDVVKAILEILNHVT